MRVTFLHPDLGIGGAERLVVDAAMALKKKGHHVKFVTNHFSRDHCFDDVLEFEIKNVDVFPRSIYGQAYALCAYIRLCIAALYVCWQNDSDIVFCDQISAALLIFRLLLSRSKLLFYCHFPDQLLTKRETFLKSVYRYFLDGFESWTTGLADVICVNSKFTKSVFCETFPRLANREPEVLYPTLHTRKFDESPRVEIDYIPNDAQYIFLSINRYEVKKNIELALQAFAKLRDQLKEQEFKHCFLIIAGGYDKLNSENILYYEKLQQDIIDLDIPEEQVVFVRSPSDAEKIELYRRCTMVIYTPKNEHFGIVPLEGMYMSRCVVATDTGGPTETVINGRTGFLCKSDSYSFALAMSEAVRNPELVEHLGKNGKQRVMNVFSFDAFASFLNKTIITM